MTESRPAVEFRHVRFGHASGRAVLTDLSLAVPPGESFALIGRSGAGKTTILKLINRLLEPTAGTVLVEGRSTLQWDPIRLRRRVGYVIQEIGLFPHLTVARNVGIVPSLEGWAPDRIHARVEELLDLVGLPISQFGDRYPHELSGGQRQRVGVARAVAADPPLLLLDEPFGALDPVTRTELQQAFLALQARLNKTVVLITHDLPEACLLGTRIGWIQEGRVLACLPPNEFLKSPHPEIQAMVQSLQASERSAHGLT
ncbi:MAG: ATP-binding cassette domain-containing protein [Nitrospirales bacterium]